MFENEELKKRLRDDEYARSFLRWERELTGEWYRSDALKKAYKQDNEDDFRRWVIGKLTALFALIERNEKNG